jgi:thioredoxin-like negative regulator of GroEL
VRLAEVDLDAHKDLQTQLKIQSFPTLLLFKNGVAINFGGSRNKEFMTSWLGKKIQEPIIRIDQARLATLETDGNVNIVLHGAADTPQYNALLAIAKADDYNSNQ